ncbi:hypothetical protein SASPL_129931 [Salvia splendens]|uniref:Polygalacturonase n=1 Tax=Salvia splendens TaxID=180675 RepID=A0A8X8ZJ03_SALSN|nr:hypothetical protein SASPL_129931 [Salvia splendens]
MEQMHVITLAIFGVLLLPLSAYAAVYDVSKEGVQNRDITNALLKVWKRAVEAPTASKVLIPKGQWTLKQALLAGPNKAPIDFQVEGTVTAYSDPFDLPDKKGEWWIGMNYLHSLTVSGGGILDGNGKVAWTKNDCHKNTPCTSKRLPYNLSFNFINNSLIKDITIKDSKYFQSNCISSRNVTFQRIKISAPAESPNTDGIHIARSVNIKVLDSVIGTGDDCISFGDEIKDVLIKNVRCGPGHGISIGSLGKTNEEKDVTGITIDNCTFINTGNGVRIKTWPSTPSTLKVTDIKFTNLIMQNKASLVQISKLKIDNIKGTSATQDVLIFSCSSTKPCQDVHIGNIDLRFSGDPKLGGPTTQCQNVKYTSTGKQNPPLCVKTSAPKPLPK